MRYCVELMDMRDKSSIGRFYNTYEQAQFIAMKVREIIISSGIKGFIVMVRNELDQVLWFKALR